MGIMPKSGMLNLLVYSGWNVMTHGDAQERCEGETSEMSE